MAVKTAELYVEKPVQDLYILNITPQVKKHIKTSRIRNGIATVFIGCSTASITTMNHNEENVKSMKAALEHLAPSDYDYEHHKTCGDIYGVGGDNNGKSHIRSSILGPSVTVPLRNGKLLLDKGQDIVFMDFDIIRRKRKVIVQIVGE